MHVVLSEVSSGNFSNDCDGEDADFSDEYEEDLSDTDDEDEWNHPQAV